MRHTDISEDTGTILRSLGGLTRANWVRLVFITTFFVFVFLVLLNRGVMAGISHDEYQFVAGGQLFRENRLLPYLDYPFLHMPYMPLINGVVLQFSQQDLLIARLFNELCIFISTLLIFILIIKLVKNINRFLQISLGILAVLLFITDSSLVSMDGRALNHSIPILLGIAIMGIYWNISSSQSRRIHLLIIGLFAGLSIGIRLNYLVICAPVIFAILFDPQYKDHKEKIYSFAFFVSGLSAALIPAGILFLLAPKPFIYGNFHYIALNTVYRKNLDYVISMSLLDKFMFFHKEVLSNPANLLLYIGLIVLPVITYILWKRNYDREAFFVVFIYMFAVVLLITAFAPTPLWPQYFFGPVPFLIFGLIFGSSVVFRSNRTLWLSSLLPILMVVLIFQHSLPSTFDLKNILHPEMWTTTKVHQLSIDIQANSGCQQKCKILTLVPILPMEAGLSSYPMFAVGSFSWRTAPILSKERRNEYRIISYDDLPEYLNNDPPAAILTGTEANFDGFTKYDPGGLDLPFIEYAKDNQYRPQKIISHLSTQDLDLTLWVRENGD